MYLFDRYCDFERAVLVVVNGISIVLRISLPLLLSLVVISRGQVEVKVETGYYMAMNVVSILEFNGVVMFCIYGRLKFKKRESASPGVCRPWACFTCLMVCSYS